MLYLPARRSPGRREEAGEVMIDSGLPLLATNQSHLKGVPAQTLLKHCPPFMHGWPACNFPPSLTQVPASHVIVPEHSGAASSVPLGSWVQVPSFSGRLHAEHGSPQAKLQQNPSVHCP